MTANPFIYFSGDSHMAGTELADDTLPSWGGYVTTEWIVAEDPADKKIRLSKHHEEHRTMPREQRINFNNTVSARHWSSIVCDKHGIEHYNDGVAGSSQEAVLHRAIFAFDKFEQEGKVPTLAIIQLIKADRITVFDEKSFLARQYPGDINWSRLYNGFDKSLICNFSQHMNHGVDGQYLLAHMNVESETGTIVRWWTALAITNSFFKEKTGRYPIYVKALKYADPEQALEAIPSSSTVLEYKTYKRLFHQARLNMVDRNIWNLSNCNTDNLMCPNWHHTPQTHVNFAQFIEPHLLQELNNDG